MKTININYIHYLYYPLISMTDDELSAFQINDPLDRANLFNSMRATLEEFGPKTKSNIRNCLEYIISTHTHDKYWNQLIPHEVPLDEIKDKREYINNLYITLFQHSPRACKGEIVISQEVPYTGLTPKD